MLTILSDDTNQKVGERLYQELLDKNIVAEYISTANVNVGPCYSCEGCTTKASFGKCVHRDDADGILARLVRSDVMVMVTPVTWGSYSYQTKRVFDKSAVIGDRHYYVKKGEMVKGMMGSIQRFYAVGVKDACSEEEKEIFKKLVAENIHIMNITGNAFVVGLDPNRDCLSKIAEEMSR